MDEKKEGEKTTDEEAEEEGQGQEQGQEQEEGQAGESPLQEQLKKSKLYQKKSEKDASLDQQKEKFDPTSGPGRIMQSRSMFK